MIHPRLLPRHLLRHFFLEEVEKGENHAYLSRKGGPGNYHGYVYAKSGDRHDTGKGGKATVDPKIFTDHKRFQLGHSFSAGKGKGHWIIDAIDAKGKLSIRNDETGATKLVTKKAFENTLVSAHKYAIQRHLHEGITKRLAVARKVLSTYPDAPAAKRAISELKRWIGPDTDKKLKQIYAAGSGEIAEKTTKAMMDALLLIEQGLGGTMPPAVDEKIVGRKPELVTKKTPVKTQPRSERMAKLEGLASHYIPEHAIQLPELYEKMQKDGAGLSGPGQLGDILTNLTRKGDARLGPWIEQGGEIPKKEFVMLHQNSNFIYFVLSDNKPKGGTTKPDTTNIAVPSHDKEKSKAAIFDAIQAQGAGKHAIPDLYDKVISSGIQLTGPGEFKDLMSELKAEGRIDTHETSRYHHSKGFENPELRSLGFSENARVLGDVSIIGEPPPKATPPPKLRTKKATPKGTTSHSSIAEHMPIHESVPIASLMSSLKASGSPMSDEGSLHDVLREMEKEGSIRFDKHLGSMYGEKNPEAAVMLPGSGFSTSVTRTGEPSPEALSVALPAKGTSERKQIQDSVLDEISSKKWTDIPDLYKSVKEKGVNIGKGGLNSILSDLAENRDLSMGPWTAPHRKIPKPEHAIIQEGNTVIYHVQKREGEPVKKSLFINKKGLR